MDNFDTLFQALNLRANNRESLNWFDIRNALLEAHTEDIQSSVQPLIGVTSITYYYLLQVRVREAGNTEFHTYTQHCKKLKPVNALLSDFEACFGIEVEEYEIAGLTPIADDIYNIIYGDN